MNCKENGNGERFSCNIQQLGGRMNNMEYTKLYNDEIEFLDTIDIWSLIQDRQDVWNLMQVIKEKYSQKYYEGVVFNCVSEQEFVDYLIKRYGRKIFIQEHTEYRIHLND